MLTNLFAVLVCTNLVYHPCTGGTPGGKCQWCIDALENDAFGIDMASIRVPEHINRVGYDCDFVVTTQYLPVIQITKEDQ